MTAGWSLLLVLAFSLTGCGGSGQTTNLPEATSVTEIVTEDNAVQEPAQEATDGAAMQVTEGNAVQEPTQEATDGAESQTAENNAAPDTLQETEAQLQLLRQ